MTVCLALVGSHLWPDNEPRYTRCPRCRRRTVRAALRRNGEDNHYCTWKAKSYAPGYCGFYFYDCLPDASDKAAHAAWLAINDWQPAREDEHGG